MNPFDSDDSDMDGMDDSDMDGLGHDMDGMSMDEDEDMEEDDDEEYPGQYPFLPGIHRQAAFMRRNHRGPHDLSSDEEDGGLAIGGAPGFQLRNSLDSRQATQPASLALDLKTEQLHTLGWMMQREGRTSDGAAPFVSTQTFERRVADTEVSVQLRLQRTYRNVRGGICGDSMGYGKTACFIALVSETLGDRIHKQLLPEEAEMCRSRVMTNATLVIAPPNLFDQWNREFAKFVRPDIGIKVVPVANHQRMKTLKVKDFVEADVVLVSFKMFFSEAYRMYLDELTNPECRNKVWDNKRQKEIDEARKKAKASGKPEMMKIFAPSYIRHPDVAKRRHFPEREASGQKRFFRWARKTVPTKKTSTEYRKLQTNPAYCAKRYVHLGDHVEGLLGGATEALAESKALFEMFYWKRVCFDEFHEVVRVKDGLGSLAYDQYRRVTVHALHTLTGRYMWGLTGTPLLSSTEAVADMASLLHVFIPPDDEGEAKRWLDEWVRSNTWDKSLVSSEEHWVTVTMTRAEQALYLNQRNIVEGARHQEGQLARHAEDRLLRLCTHFDPDNRQIQHAEDAVSATKERQRETLQRAEEGIAECETRLAQFQMQTELQVALRHVLEKPKPADVRLVCAHLEPEKLVVLKSRVDALELKGTESKDMAWETERSALAKDCAALMSAVREASSERDMCQSFKKATAQKITICCNFKKGEEDCEACRHLYESHEYRTHLNRSKGIHEGKRKEMTSQIRFLDQAMQSLEGKSLECPFCLEDTDPSGTDVGVLTCGHAFHEACIRQSLAQNPLCPVCRHPSSAEQITNVALHFKGPGEGAQAKQPTELQLKCGSKIAAIVEKIQEIQGGEGGADEKCVVFIQWDHVMRSLESALRLVGLKPLMLHGPVTMRQTILRQFIDGKDLESSVLLLSLEQSPSGMNLVCARNLLLVHPMSAKNKQEAINFERQAIGRVVRQGQKRKVRIYRFVTKDTVEEEITRRHHAEIFSASSGQGGDVGKEHLAVEGGSSSASSGLDRSAPVSGAASSSSAAPAASSSSAAPAASSSSASAPEASAKAEEAKASPRPAAGATPPSALARRLSLKGKLKAPEVALPDHEVAGGPSHELLSPDSAPEPPVAPSAPLGD